MAAKIANETAKVFKAEVSKVMNVDNVNILSKAVVKENIKPVKPIPALNILIGIVIGLIISIATAFILEFSDKSIKTEVDIEKYLDLPVMGVVANIEDIPVSSSRSSRVSNQASSRVRGESIGS
jgi:capsular polysaccharide biosynthesis protein